MDSTLTRKAGVAFSSKTLTGPKVLLLMLSNRKQGGHVVADLVRLSGLSHPTLNAAKESLIRDDLIEEHYPQRDKRTIKIYLTDKGRKKAKELWDDLAGILAIREGWISADLT